MTNAVLPHSHTPRHVNRLGGTCRRNHRLTHETVYLRADGWYRCAVCQAERDAMRKVPKPAPPDEKPCDRCRAVKPIVAYDTLGAKVCRKCIDTRNNNRRGAVAKRETASRKAEAVSIVAFCRTGTDRLIAERGWTNRRIATAVGVPRWTFRHWLLGKRLPLPSRVAGLAEAMTALLAREGLI